MRKDHLHISARRQDSYNKPFNVCISEREPGKSTLWQTKAYKLFKYKKRPTIVLRRQTVDITETYINSIEESINLFQTKQHKIKIEYKKGDIKEGIVDVTINGRLFLRIVSLSLPKSRVKSTVIKQPAMMIYDECIVDERNGEKYATNEIEKIMEIYNTYRRFCKDNNGKEYTLKFFAYGNPYSLNCPVLTWLGVDLFDLRPGQFVVGSNYTVYVYKMKEELRQHLLETNPLYQFDDSYNKIYREYALYGRPINDANYRIERKKPNNYKLRYVIKTNNKYLEVYAGCENDFNYWIKDSDTTQASRTAIAMDLNNLSENTKLITPMVRLTLVRLKLAISKRNVTYSSIHAGYLMESIYNHL